MYKTLSIKTGFCENIHFQILVMEILKTDIYDEFIFLHNFTSNR